MDIRPMGNNPRFINFKCDCGITTRIPTIAAMYEPIPEGETCSCWCHGSVLPFKDTDLAICYHCAYRYAI